MNEIKGKKILIVGFGREGKSVLNYLKKHYTDIHITLADKNEITSNTENYRTRTGNAYLDHLETFDSVIRSPGIPIQLLKNAKHITSATNVFFESCPGITIGITGTKGKSTTSALIHHILQTAGKDARLVGNIGNPALDSLEESTPQTYFVIELSSHQLADFHYRPYIAVILPVVPEHLPYHGTFKNYVDAKTQLVLHQSPTDAVIYYPYNESSRLISEKGKAKTYAYAQKGTSKIAAWLENQALLVSSKEGQIHQLLHLTRIPLLGKANYENVCAAVLVGLLFDIPLEHIRKAIETFHPLEHRLELVGTFKGITFYNDSIATTPQATLHALQALENKVTTLIAGGFDRGLDYTDLGKILVNSSVKHLILLPETGIKIAQSVKAAGMPVTLNLKEVKTLAEAVKLAYHVTPQGTICLLSPAAASYNQFKDFADRGTQFKKFIRKYSSS